MKLDRDALNHLFQYALSLTANRDDAYDLLQTALEKLIKSKANSDCSKAYIRTIIRNQFIDQQRRNNILVFEQLEDDNISLLATDPLEKAIINRNQIENLMNNLNPAEREALFLWAVNGLTASEIARETGEPRGTILSRLYRIKQKVATSQQNSEALTTEGGSQ